MQTQRFLRLMMVMGLALSLTTGVMLTLGGLGEVHARPLNATLTVTNTNDSGPGSLRDALNQANPGDTIDFAVTGIITLSEALTITHNLTIDGPGADQLTISGNHATRAFSITGGTVVISGVTVADGVAMGSYSPETGSGGGIYSEIDVILQLENCIIRDNHTWWSGGGVCSLGPITLSGCAFQDNTADHGFGGGLYADSSLSMTSTQFIGNIISGTGVGGGAAVRGLTTINEGIFQNNSASSGDGGGLIVSGPVVLNGGTFEDNYSLNDGGGLYVEESLHVSGTQFISNTAGSSGGGLYVKQSLLAVDTQFISNAGGYGGGAYVSGPATVNEGVFQDNTSFYGGGGLAASDPVVLNGGLFQNNTVQQGGYGGGLFTYNGLYVTGTQFISNTIVGDGGGATVIGGSVVLNGGLFLRNTSQKSQYSSAFGGGLLVISGDVIMTDTQFISNTAGSSGGGGVCAVSGTNVRVSGGLFQGNRCVGSACAGGGLIARSLVMSDTRFISNTASGDGNSFGVGGSGGGAYVQDSATLYNGVFEDNNSLYDGGGLYVEKSLQVTGTQFLNNFTTGNGGGVYQRGYLGSESQMVNALLAGNAANGQGSAMYLRADDDTARLKILHTTIANPTVGSGTAIVIESGSVGITNTLIASYTTGISRTGGAVYEDYNLFFNITVSKTGVFSTGSGLHDVTGDPRFANPTLNDYRLITESAAINRGIGAGITVDFEGTGRPQGGGYDIGYDESLWSGGGSLLQSIYLPVVLKEE